MTLEELLVEDRVRFETRVVPLNDDKERQDSEAVALFNDMVGIFAEAGPRLVYVKQRLDAFMHQLVKYKIGPTAGLYVLRATISTATEYPNRKALGEYVSTFPSPTLTGSTTVESDHLFHKRATVGMNTLRELKGLCSEYEDWLDRMHELAPTANPKNHPTTQQLRERDAIRLKINNLATPNVISALVRIAMKERGEV